MTTVLNSAVHAPVDAIRFPPFKRVQLRHWDLPGGNPDEAAGLLIHTSDVARRDDESLVLGFEGLASSRPWTVAIAFVFLKDGVLRYSTDKWDAEGQLLLWDLAELRRVWLVGSKLAQELSLEKILEVADPTVITREGLLARLAELPSNVRESLQPKNIVIAAGTQLAVLDQVWNDFVGPELVGKYYTDEVLEGDASGVRPIKQTIKRTHNYSHFRCRHGYSVSQAVHEPAKGIITVCTRGPALGRMVERTYLVLTKTKLLLLERRT